MLCNIRKGKFSIKFAFFRAIIIAYSILFIIFAAINCVFSSLKPQIVLQLINSHLCNTKKDTSLTIDMN